MTAASNAARSEATRARVLAAALRLTEENSGIPPALADVARACHLHENTVCLHVRELVEAGEWPTVPRQRLMVTQSMRRKWEAAQRLIRATYPDRRPRR